MATQASYLITTEHHNELPYVVAVEDEFGFVPLFAVADFDRALTTMESAKRDEVVFTELTEALMCDFIHADLQDGVLRGGVRS